MAMNYTTYPGRLALLVGGGPAPGINGVISAATIEARNHGIEVIGIQDGFQWLMKSDGKQHWRFLDIKDVKDHALRGGSILGTSRANPARSKDDMARVVRALHEMGVSALVTIGGDDTAFSAGQVYHAAEGRIRIADVPKTIDNDLPLPDSIPTFGFETARQVGVGIVRNLREDARTASRWYVIVSMGRAAGFLALGIGKAAAATLTIIPEEFQGRKITLDHVCDIVVGAIIKRRNNGQSYGVAVVAEGLIEAIGEAGLLEAHHGAEGLARYGTLERDAHGHLRLGEIDFGRMIRDRVAERLRELDLATTLVDKELGYELRCADPIPFDAEYTRDLGYGAVKFLRTSDSERYPAMISFNAGRLHPLRLQDIQVPATGRMKPRKVNTEGETYEVARRYMIRLEAADFRDSKRLAELAATANLGPDQFRQRFGYLIAPQ
jgi:6-phosphofructokinase 1